MGSNPLTMMSNVSVSIFRAPVLGDQIETVTYYYVAIMTVVGIAVAATLYRRYARFVPLWI